MDDLKNEIYANIKVARENRFLTNCYSMDVVEQCRKIWCDGLNIMFSYEDHGIERLIYFVKSWDKIDSLLKQVEKGKYYFEFMTKNPDEYEFKSANLIAKMMRMSNQNCKLFLEEDLNILKYKDSAVIETATDADTKEINDILWTTFHTEISHLLYDDELTKKIMEGQISVHRNIYGQIDALLQAEVLPKKFYINQIVNKTKKNVIHAILIKRLENYVKSGGKYIYAWVEDKNIASVKFHEKYGMKCDGMYSLIYCFER